MQIIQGVLYLLICFGIFSTLLMMLVERKFEMGMLLAIGMSKYKMAFMLLTESLFTLFTGSLLGMIAGLPVVSYLNTHPIHIAGETARAYEKFGFEPIFPAALDATVFWQQTIIILIIGFLLSLYPIFKIIRLDPATAMNKH